MSNQTLLYQSESRLLICVAHWSFTYFYQRTWDAEAQPRHRHKITLVHPIVIGHVRGGCSIAAMASEDFLSKTTYTIEASRGTELTYCSCTQSFPPVSIRLNRSFAFFLENYSRFMHRLPVQMCIVPVEPGHLCFVTIYRGTSVIYQTRLGMYRRAYF
jgi:hypothetical protein